MHKAAKNYELRIMYCTALGVVCFLTFKAVLKASL